jgi:hypothetical protein
MIKLRRSSSDVPGVFGSLLGSYFEQQVTNVTKTAAVRRSPTFCHHLRTLLTERYLVVLYTIIDRQCRCTASDMECFILLVSLLLLRLIVIVVVDDSAGACIGVGGCDDAIVVVVRTPRVLVLQLQLLLRRLVVVC